MTFLVPLFLIGGLLIAGPIVAHLIRRQTKERIRFSDTRLLEPSPPRLQRRSRIENWWLLALRCLIVLVLTAGFARPFFRRELPIPPASTAPRHVVAVLDTSASMRREGRWTDAVARVRAATRSLGATDRFALLTAGSEIALLINGEQWTRTPEPDRNALVETALAGSAAGWGPTRLDAAIDAALDEATAMAETGEVLATTKIIVVSDCTMGARVSGLAGRDWPPGCTVEIQTIEGPRAADVSLQWLGWTTADGGGRAARARLVNHENRNASVLLHLRELGARRDVAPAQSFPLAPNENRMVLVDVPAELTEPLRLELEGDEEAFNNTLWLVPPQPREIALPYFGAHAVQDSRHALFYLSRATNGWRDPKVQVTVADDAAMLAPAPLLVIAEALSADDARRVRDRVTAGAFALVLLGDASVVPTAAALVDESGWAAAPAPPPNALLGSINFQHPLFAPFADPRYSDFTRVRFWKPVPVAVPEDSKATIVARFDDGSPAVLEAEVGQGRVIVWGGDWSNVASQWVLSTKFVPWLQALVERAAGGPPRPECRRNWRRNESRDRRRRALARRRHRMRTRHAAGFPPLPGVYQVTENGRARAVALQVPVAESRNEPLPADTWEQLGVPVESKAVTTATPGNEEQEQKKVAASDTATESQQQYWRWTLIGAALLLAIESVAALRSARRMAQLQTA